MQCCVPFCQTTAGIVSESAGITFHKFPSEVHLRAAWLRALGTQDSHLPDSAVVCSQHFLSDDMWAAESGSRQVRTGAIPSVVQVCMICLDAHSKLFLMNKYKLDEAYQHLVGQPPCDSGNLKQTLCIQCAHRLLNFNKFRDKSLRARALMMELVEKHELISMQHIDTFNEANNRLKHNIVKTILDPNHCDLYINADTDKRTDITATLESVPIKNEATVPMLVDEEITQQNVLVKHDTEKGFNINLVVTKEEYLSDEEPKQLTDPLLVQPSTSKQPVEEPLPQIKYEITFECSICLEEFLDEDTYNYHMSMHMEENQNQTEEPSAEFGHSTLVAPLTWNLATTPKQEVSTPETVEPVEKKMKVQNVSHQNLGIQTQEENAIRENAKELRENAKELPENAIRENAKELPVYNTPAKHKHTRTDDKPIACKLCDYRCARTWQLNKHIKIHSPDNPFVCQTCGFQSTCQTEHVKHNMRNHVSEKRFACEICDFKVANKGNLANHMKTHSRHPLFPHIKIQVAEKPFACQVCDLKFARKFVLDIHMSKTHPREKRSLSQIKIHSGEKSFVCQVCDFKFAREFELDNHMSKTHSHEKRSFCVFRNERTSRNGQLEIDCPTHTSENPFVCDVCNFKFALKIELANHMKTHSPEKP